MSRFAVALGVLVLLLPAGAGRTAAVPVPLPDRPLLGIVWTVNDGRLARLDPETAEPLATSPQDLDRHLLRPAFSPDGSQLALVRDTPPSVRLLDATTLQALGDADLRGVGRYATALVWPRSGPLLVALNACCSPRLLFATVDPVTRAVASSASVTGSAVAGAASRDAMVLLVAPTDAIGTARLVVFDGRVRVVSLPSVGAGTKVADVISIARPGLAVDPAARRAYVISATGPVVEVDLGSLRVTRHALHERRSFLRRALGALEPAAEAKVLSGPDRDALWLGDGLIAVSGTDSAATKTGRTFRWSTAPAGLRVVDTRDWSFRTIAARATWARFGAGVLFAGGTYKPSPKTTRWVTEPLSAYDRDGRRVLQLDRTATWVQTWGPYAYIEKRAVLELPSGRVVHALDPGRRMPYLLPLEPVFTF